MADVVQPQAGQAGVGDQAGEGGGDSHRVEMAADFVGEHQVPPVAPASAGRGAVAVLDVAAARERRGGVAIQARGAVAAGLGAFEAGVAVDDLQRAAHHQRGRGEVDVVPPQPHQLAAAQPRAGRGAPQLGPRVGIGEGEERPQLLGAPHGVLAVVLVGGGVHRRQLRACGGVGGQHPVGHGVGQRLVQHGVAVAHGAQAQRQPRAPAPSARRGPAARRRLR
jgi:hypothetical protein